MAGRLLVIGTPIGNLADLSPRAAAALRECALLLCEDKRHTAKLLQHHGIRVPLESMHEHNEDAKVERLVGRIEQGETIGLVSDAGTPLLSDPGFPLLRLARDRRVRVEPIPGPFAATLALVASGLPPLPFAFLGFAPHRAEERLEFYRRLAQLGMTTLVYESPLRLVESLRTAREVLGNVEITVGREMTKLHEELLNGRIDEVIDTLERRDAIRGEITIVFGAAEEMRREPPPLEELRRELAALRDSGLRRNDAIRLLADRYGLDKRELYKALL